MELENYIVGIDFGTTYSCISVWKDRGLMILPNGIEERTGVPASCLTGETSTEIIAKAKTLISIFVFFALKFVWISSFVF